MGASDPSVGGGDRVPPRARLVERHVQRDRERFTDLHAVGSARVTVGERGISPRVLRRVGGPTGGRRRGRRPGRRRLRRTAPGQHADGHDHRERQLMPHCSHALSIRGRSVGFGHLTWSARTDVRISALRAVPDSHARIPDSLTRPCSGRGAAGSGRREGQAGRLRSSRIAIPISARTARTIAMIPSVLAVSVSLVLAT